MEWREEPDSANRYDSSEDDEFNQRSPPASRSARPSSSPATRTEETPPPDGAAKIPLSIKTLDGKTYKITAWDNWTVRKLKEEFQEWRGEEAMYCNMQYRAKKMKDDEVLSTYKMTPDSIVQVNFRSTGGD